MKKNYKDLLTLCGILVILAISGYFTFIYTPPIDLDDIRVLLDNQDYVGISLEIKRYRSSIDENDREQLLNHVRQITEANDESLRLLNQAQSLDGSIDRVISALSEKKYQLEKTIKGYKHMEDIYNKRKHIWGVILQRLESDLYEIRTQYGRHALLVTTSTEFSSTGDFNMSVFETGTQKVELTSGFTKRIPVFTQFNNSEYRALGATKSALEGDIESLKNSLDNFVKTKEVNNRKYIKSNSIIASLEDSLFTLLSCYHVDE